MIYLIENALSNQIDYYTWYNAFWSMDWKKSIRTWITSSLLIGVKKSREFGWSLGSIFHHLISSILWLYYIYMLLNNITEHHGLKSQRVALSKTRNERLASDEKNCKVSIFPPLSPVLGYQVTTAMSVSFYVQIWG